LGGIDHSVGIAAVPQQDLQHIVIKALQGFYGVSLASRGGYCQHPKAVKPNQRKATTE